MLRFPIVPRLALGKSLRGRATACMDISDGIALDLYRMCVASGVAAELERVPLAKGATSSDALHKGEDYELLFTIPSAVHPKRGGKHQKTLEDLPRGCVRVGTIVKGKPGSVWFQGELLPPRGYDHFAKK